MAEAGHVEGEAADASTSPSRARRLIQIVLGVLVAFVVPVLLLDALVGQYSANAMVLGVVVGALGSKIGGTRRMLYLAPAIGLAGGATTIFRREDREWKIVHRHADSTTTPRPVESVVEQL